MAWRATNTEGYAAPAALRADVVVLTVREAAPHVLTVGGRALPGGFVGEGEDPAGTARRKLREKTGLDRAYLEQLATFARPGRDPRGWIPTVAHLALVPGDTSADDPAAVWVPVGGPVAEAPAAPARIPADGAGPGLELDHPAIVAAALERVRGKLWWSNVAVGVLPGAFPISDARVVYEAFAGTAYDPATFARDLKATGLVAPTGERRSEGRGRPAALYRFVSERPTWGAGRRKRLAT